MAEEIFVTNGQYVLTLLDGVFVEVKPPRYFGSNLPLCVGLKAGDSAGDFVRIMAETGGKRKPPERYNTLQYMGEPISVELLAKCIEENTKSLVDLMADSMADSMAKSIKENNKILLDSMTESKNASKDI